MNPRINGNGKHARDEHGNKSKNTEMTNIDIAFMRIWLQKKQKEEEKVKRETTTGMCVGCTMKILLVRSFPWRL